MVSVLMDARVDVVASFMVVIGACVVVIVVLVEEIMFTFVSLSPTLEGECVDSIDGDDVPPIENGLSVDDIAFSFIDVVCVDDIPEWVLIMLEYVCVDIVRRLDAVYKCTGVVVLPVVVSVCVDGCVVPTTTFDVSSDSVSVSLMVVDFGNGDMCVSVTLNGVSSDAVSVSLNDVSEDGTVVLLIIVSVCADSVSLNDVCEVSPVSTSVDVVSVPLDDVNEYSVAVLETGGVDGFVKSLFSECVNNLVVSLTEVSADGVVESLNSLREDGFVSYKSVCGDSVDDSFNSLSEFDVVDLFNNVG